MTLPRWILTGAVIAVLAGCASDETATSQEATAGGGATTPGTTAPGGVQRGTLPGGGYGGGSGAASPAGGVAAQAEQQIAQVGDTVFFAYDRFDLDERAQRTLDQQASVLLRYAQVNVIIEGHCDERGTREYNLALGERRATAVKEYLAALGVAPARMRAISYGEERPLVVGSNESAWAQNRRAVTVVVGGVGS
jgi:peptidoglycan-associated lipoprotein